MSLATHQSPRSAFLLAQSIDLRKKVLKWFKTLASVWFCRRDGKSLERFLEDYFAKRLKRYVKSEPVPESNDGPVKVHGPTKVFLSVMF